VVELDNEAWVDKNGGKNTDVISVVQDGR
jgi:hypothetical protein